MFRVFWIDIQLVSTVALQGIIRGYVNSYLGLAQPTVNVRVAAGAPVVVAPLPSLGKIAFVNDPGPTASICTMKHNGTGRTTVLSEGLAGEPAWSPGGLKIAFVSYRDNHAQPYVMDADGSNQRRLTSTGPLSTMTCGGPRWSFDGAKILLSAIGGMGDRYWQIYTINADGSNQQHFTTGDMSKTYAVWMRNGRLAFFLGAGDGTGDIYSVGLNGQNPIRTPIDPGWSKKELATTGSPTQPTASEVPQTSMRFTCGTALAAFEASAEGTTRRFPRTATGSPTRNGRRMLRARSRVLFT